MRSLLHEPLDPASRMARLFLAEKKLNARLVVIAPGETSEELAAHNPAQTLPVLIDEAPNGDDVTVAPVWVICEYLEEAYGAPHIYPATSAGRAEARRIVSWFCDRFETDVVARTLRPRLTGSASRRRVAGMSEARDSAEALCWHLDYLSWLLEQRRWLAGEMLTAADLAGAAGLSSIDYLGIVPWRDFPQVKDWYQRVKSRPAFQPLLADRIEGLAPPAHYADLDF